MKKSFYWSLALIAGLVVAGLYSTNVFAEDALPTEPEVPPAVVEEALVEEPVAPADTDADTVADDTDNCVDVSNEDQADVDENGVGDACDELVPEVQGASIESPKSSEVETETEESGTDFWATLSEEDATDGDFDDDGIADEDDNCLIVANKDQADEDANDIGDACEEAGFGPGSIEEEDAPMMMGRFAFPSDPDVTLCHYDDGSYETVLDTTITEVIALLHGILPGHDEDIIPPFNFGFLNILLYSGKNWDAEGQAIYNNGCEVPPPPLSCTLTVVSDDVTEVSGNETFLVTPPHPSWTSIAMASWIWNVLINGATDDAALGPVTFTRDFVLDGIPASASFEISADNGYTVKLNGNSVCSDPAEQNWSSVDNCSGAIDLNWLNVGSNTLEIVVDNYNKPDGYTGPNPGGLLYKLILNGESQEACEEPDPQGDTLLTVIKNVDNAFNGTLQSSDFNLNVTWYTGNSNDESEPWRGFPGSTTGTTFDVEPGNFLVGEDWVPGYSMVIDTNAGPRCAGGQTLHDDEHLTCTVTNKQLAYGGNETPMCELEGEGWYGEYFNYPKSREDMYSIYEADPVAGDDGLYTMKWGEPTDPTSTSSQWYDVDGEYFKFSRVDADLEFGDMFWPFYGGLVEEETYGSGRDFNFGVHWSATVDVPSDATPADYYTYGKFDDDVFVYVNGVLDVDSSATGVHGPVAVTGTLNLKDGDVIDVYYADRAQGESSMYLEFINNTDGQEGNEISFAPYNDDCNLVCDPEQNLIVNGSFEDPVVTGNGGDWELFFSGITGWVADFVSDGSDAPLEVQAGYSGWTAADGDQYAELDSTASTLISQDIPTIPGATYQLTYKRAARPGNYPAEDNAVEALVDGNSVDTSVFNVISGNPDWYPSPVIQFEAGDATTTLSFKDIGPTQGGSSNSLGIFIDDVQLYCISEPTEDTSTVTICKYEDSLDGDLLGGWTVWLEEYFPVIYKTVVDEDTNDYFEGITVSEGEDLGCVTFNNVPYGDYDLGENMQIGWEFVSSSETANDSDHVTVNDGTESFYIVNSDEDGGSGDESCLVEGYKYDEEGNPLSGWFIGLEGYYYPEYTRQEIVIYEEQLIGSDVTDENGYYCIPGEVRGEGSNYSVYEVIQEGWDNIGAEVDGSEVSEYYDNGDIASVDIGYLGDGMDVNFINQHEGSSDEQCSDDVDNDNDEATDENDSDCQEDTPETPNDDDDNNGRPGSNRNSFSGRGEVLGATTETNFCPFLRDYQHINMKNDPAEVNKAKAFFNAYLGMSLPLDGTFDSSMFNAVVQFQNMFKPDVLDTWTEEFPSLNDNATGYLYQTTKWKINSIICPGYETFPDQLIMAPGTTVN